MKQHKGNVQCFYCECSMCVLDKNKPTSATRDHIIPKSRGGSDKVWNIVISCKRCNNIKADFLPIDFIQESLNAIRWIDDNDLDHVMWLGHVVPKSDLIRIIKNTLKLLQNDKTKRKFLLNSIC